MAQACRSKKPPANRGEKRKQSAHMIDAKERDEEIEETSEDAGSVSETEQGFSLFLMQSSRAKPTVIGMKVNVADLNMELDKGAAVSIVSEET